MIAKGKGMEKHGKTTARSLQKSSLSGWSASDVRRWRNNILNYMNI
jgi:hypothetical protein